jgi:hypothetical protein
MLHRPKEDPSYAEVLDVVFVSSLEPCHVMVLVSCVSSPTDLRASAHSMYYRHRYTYTQASHGLYTYGPHAYSLCSQSLIQWAGHASPKSDWSPSSFNPFYG